MTYLSRIRLNPRSGRVQSELADCQRLHCTILAAFPDIPDDAARAALRILYRVEDVLSPPHILVQSAVAPDWSSLPRDSILSDPDVLRIDQVYAGLEEGQNFRFRLRANPTKRVLREAPRGDKSWVGKRVNLIREEDQIAWLQRKAEGGGFELLRVTTAREVPNVRATTQPRERGRRDGRMLAFGSVLFDGELRVTDSDRLRETLTTGIGSGKAYGFGLLSIAAG